MKKEKIKEQANMALPSFIIIGASKSGTTSLYEYLRQHPQVFMSPIKETNFFTCDNKKPEFRTNVTRDIVYKFEDYKALFRNAKNKNAIGEVSPLYMFIPGAAGRIKKRIPDIKLIAILRNPVDRAFSHFSMHRRDGFEPYETLAEAIADEPRRAQDGWVVGQYLMIGYYGRQLQRYYNYFDRDQIRVYLYDDLVQDPVKLLKDIFQFIGVDENYLPDMSRKFNKSGVIKNSLLRFLWTKTHTLRLIIRPALSRNIRQSVAGFFNSRKLVKLHLPDETRSQLLDLYHEDILKLQELIQRDLSMWLK
jgi:hypothetical protein